MKRFCFIVAAIGLIGSGDSSWVPINFNETWAYQDPTNHTFVPFSSCLQSHIHTLIDANFEEQYRILYPLESIFDHNGLCLSDSCSNGLRVDYTIQLHDTQLCHEDTGVVWELWATNTTDCDYLVLRGCLLPNLTTTVEPFVSIGRCDDLMPEFPLHTHASDCDNMLEQNATCFVPINTIDVRIYVCQLKNDLLNFVFEFNNIDAFKYNATQATADSPILNDDSSFQKNEVKSMASEFGCFFPCSSYTNTHPAEIVPSIRAILEQTTTSTTATTTTTTTATTTTTQTSATSQTTTFRPANRYSASLTSQASIAAVIVVMTLFACGLAGCCILMQQKKKQAYNVLKKSNSSAALFTVG